VERISPGAVNVSLRGMSDNVPESSLSKCIIALARLDRLLDKAIALAPNRFGSAASTDPNRGLYIDRDEVERLLTWDPGVPLFPVDDDPVESDSAGDDFISSQLTWLRRAFGLSSFDLDVCVMALAPEIDLRYQRLYAYLQDDVTRKYPSVDLALNLLCRSQEDKLARRAHFTPDSVLVRHGLLQVGLDTARPPAPLLSQAFQLDAQIVNLLLDGRGVDARLRSFCELMDADGEWDSIQLDLEAKQNLLGLVDHARMAREPLHLNFCGPRGSGKRDAAQALARTVGMRLLVADLARARSSDSGFAQLLRILFREAWFRDATLYLENLHSLREEDQSEAWTALLATLAKDRGITILAGTQPRGSSGGTPGRMIVVPFPTLDRTQREACWRHHLADAGIAIVQDDLTALSGRFRVTPRQIADAVACAQNQTRWQSGNLSNQAAPRHSVGPMLSDLFEATRQQCGQELTALAQKIAPVYTWGDLVLPEDTLTQLQEISKRVLYRGRVLDDWGFAGKLSGGKGMVALFAGPSGTGKTMAAEVLANELALDLYKIDLSRIVSKWVGETEKQLDRVFTLAEGSNAILLFDEADALFGKRSEIHDAHDRYANIETSYLLQKVEQYDGLALLSTNLIGNLDEAFGRRLTFTVHFPFPDAAGRLRLWRGIWPKKTPLGKDVDLALLAARFKLSGGHIKNVALAASFLAAETGGPVCQSHLLHAIRREFQKMGKTLTDAELHSDHGGPKS
jgi:ATPase family associated with various cellular activities (AAA)